MERTLILLKPEALEQKVDQDIINRFEQHGFGVLKEVTFTPTLEQAQEHYSPHKGKPFYERITSSLARGPITALVLEGDDAIRRSRKLIGATDPQKADEGTIRKDFAKKMEENMVHGSDSTSEAEREINVWFP
jgi:nucleoside-diphosphate kinase